MAASPETLRAVIDAGRVIEVAQQGDDALGVFKNLPGTWANRGTALDGHGWNLIALPYKTPGKTVQPDTPAQKPVYRLLLNQFNEQLEFSIVDRGVPNRGAALAHVLDQDQHLAALQYVQSISQLAAADFPATDDNPNTPKKAAAIHREPGLFLHMLSQVGDGPEIARLGTIPHGDAVLAMGHGFEKEGPPDFTAVGDFSALPVGINPDVDKNGYLEPYKFFRDHKFRGVFDPTKPLELLEAAAKAVKIKKTTTLSFDTKLTTGGINNIPFVSRQANASSMRAFFWIEELEETDGGGQPVFQLQYAQRVLLDFFDFSGKPGDFVKWPHISINSMRLTTLP